MAIDFEKWTAEFGGEDAVKALKDAEENADYPELPEGTYICKLENLELGEAKRSKKPMVKAMFRIVEGEHKKQCIFYNGVMVANDPSKNGFMIHNVLKFLRSMKILEDIDVDFDGNYAHFNDLLLDMAEAADADGLKFEVFTEKEGDFNKITVTDVFE